MLGALQKWLPPSRINAVMGFLWLWWPLHWIQVLAFRVMLGSSWEQVPSFKGHLGDMLRCIYHLGPVLVPNLAFVDYVRPFLKKCWAISWPSWGDVGINSYVEGMLNNFDPCWCSELCKNDCPPAGSMLSWAFCGYLGPFIESKFWLLGSCWVHLGSKFHHLRAILATCWDMCTILGPFWCQI